MKNLHVLPTENPSRLMIDTIENKLYLQPILINKTINVLPQHIYITSDEDIKDVRPHKGKWQLEKGQILNKFPDYLTDLSECKLVIMTTDQDLIADGVQAIDDEFLNWFVKNPTCEYVEVKHFGTCCGNQSITQCINCEKYNPIYKITIPKEEPKQETLENSKLALREYILANKEKVTEDLQEMREKSGTGRDETLEEAADNYSENWEEITGLDYEDCVPFSINNFDFIAGAKWQSERMYSEEEVRELLIQRCKHFGTSLSPFDKLLLKQDLEWFEKFKK